MTFPLCARCADDVNQSQCEHSPEERSWWGEYTTFELNLAFSHGYEPLQIYEVIFSLFFPLTVCCTYAQVWHWEETAKYEKNCPGSGLFADMINDLLAQKIASSGYPADVQSDEEKEAYKREIEEHEGIELGEIEDNPAKRATSKLSTNSFWGKLGLLTFNIFNFCN